MIKQSKQILTIGAIISLLSVVIGAFGAHGLEEILTQNGRLATFETGVRYQFYHAIGILVIGLTSLQFTHQNFKISTWLMLTGIILFSGSLYALSLSNIKMLGAITPLGGLSFILGWLFYILAIIKSKNN